MEKKEKAGASKGEKTVVLQMIGRSVTERGNKGETGRQRE